MSLLSGHPEGSLRALASLTIHGCQIPGFGSSSVEEGKTEVLQHAEENSENHFIPTPGYKRRSDRALLGAPGIATRNKYSY